MEKVERVVRIANKCENCKIVFYKLPCQLKVTNKPYCSRSCYWEHRKGKPIKHFVEDKNLSNKISKALTGKPQPWMQNKKHHQWKGVKASYTAKHQWIRRKYGKADRCDNPECVYPRTNANRVIILKPKRFEWSLIHGNEHGHSRGLARVSIGSRPSPCSRLSSPI